MEDKVRWDLLRLIGSDKFSLRLIEASHKRSIGDRLNEMTSIVKECLLESSLCYCDGILSFYNGKVYEGISYKSLDTILYNVLCDMGVPATEASKLPHLALPVLNNKRVQSNNRLVAFGNCVLNLDTFQDLGFSPEQVTTYKLDYFYDRNAKAPLWNKFLEEVLPDESKRQILQEYIGMIYIDRTRISIEKCLLMLGSGANGKSVVSNVIKAMVGSKYVSPFEPCQLITEEGKYGLIGKKLNCCTEVSANDKITGALKALISHEEVSARGLYKDYITLRCPPIIFILNKLPAMPDNSYGFYRRQIILEFTRSIPVSRQDKELASKIINKELPGVFNWAMEGMIRLIDRRGEFTYCQASEDKIKEVQMDNSPILRYMELNKLSANPSYANQEPILVKSSDLYKQICQEDSISMKEFGSELKRLNFQKVKNSGIYYQIYPKNKPIN